ncbi:MAG: uracil phosphoribosyltransferase [Ignavibacteriales bacterium]|nr:uracil phosphoribosyltransferase [Ignavibacteriales bacterium]
MKNLIIIDHPLVKRDLTLLRNKKTPSHQFRAILRRTASLMAYEVSRDLQTKEIEIHTPLEKTKGIAVDQQIVLVPILRAGLGLVGGFVEVMPNARVGHIGLFRDEETLKPVDYYFKVPRNLNRALVLLLDPMLATGGSAVAAISFLKERGASTLRLVNLVSAPEGVKKVRRAHPDVVMYTCALDRELNNRGYILPGLGDAGDRMFGTE